MIQDQESGLFIPEPVAWEISEKKDETWTYDTLRKIRYAAKELDDREVDITMTCRRCQQPLMLEMEHTLDGKTRPTEKLVCKCKTRRIKRL